MGMGMGWGRGGVNQVGWPLHLVPKPSNNGGLLDGQRVQTDMFEEVAHTKSLQPKWLPNVDREVLLSPRFVPNGKAFGVAFWPFTNIYEGGEGGFEHGQK